jgi:hypothetical protein
MVEKSTVQGPKVGKVMSKFLGINAKICNMLFILTH